MAWYYAEADQQKGPVDESSLDELVRQGVVRDDTLVWREGMASWQPHAAVRRPVVPPIPGPTSAESRYCSECGRSFPGNELSSIGSALVCAGCRPAVMQRMPAATWGAPAYQTPATSVRRYGGFWIRFLGRCIDWIIIGFVSTIIRLPLVAILGIRSADLGRINDPSEFLRFMPGLAGLFGLSFLIQIALSLGYEMYFLSTRGATPGKMALGLKVIRADGGPISPGLAAGRYFGMWVSGLVFCIGYIIAGFDLEKRSLHDRICETRVIYGK